MNPDKPETSKQYNEVSGSAHHECALAHGGCTGLTCVEII